MEINPIFKIFESFPRQGAGDDEHTEKAFSIIAEPPKGGGEILMLVVGRVYRRWPLPTCARPAG